MTADPMTHPSPKAVAKTDDATLAFARKYAEVTRRSKYHDNADVAVLALDAHVTALTAQLEAERTKSSGQVYKQGFEAGQNAKVRDLTTRLSAETARADKAEAEAKALREALKKYESLTAGDWFYPDGQTSEDYCRTSPSEVLDEHYEVTHDKSGVYVIERALKLPDIYAAVRVFSDEEKDARGSDDDYVDTYHLTREEAEAALASAAQGGAK